MDKRYDNRVQHYSTKLKEGECLPDFGQPCNIVGMSANHESESA